MVEKFVFYEREAFTGGPNLTRATWTEKKCVHAKVRAN